MWHMGEGRENTGVKGPEEEACLTVTAVALDQGPIPHYHPQKTFVNVWRYFLWSQYRDVIDTY